MRILLSYQYILIYCPNIFKYEILPFWVKCLSQNEKLEWSTQKLKQSLLVLKLPTFKLIKVLAWHKVLHVAFYAWNLILHINDLSKIEIWASKYNLCIKQDSSVAYTLEANIYKIIVWKVINYELVISNE